MIRYALLGLLQGLTEFLPVSSSGHLVLARALLGVESPGVTLEAAAHLGTLGALLVYFRWDLVRLAGGLLGRREGRATTGLLLVGTVPLAAVGFLARGAIERAFRMPSLVGAMLLVTAFALGIGDLCARRARRDRVTLGDAVAVGLAQAAALLPGLSRSGATVAMGVGLGLQPASAARFSFLLAIPALTGASLVALLTVAREPGLDWVGLAVAGSCALASGLVAIHLFLRILRSGRLWPFALYCALAGFAVLGWGWLAAGELP